MYSFPRITLPERAINEAKVGLCHVFGMSSAWSYLVASWLVMYLNAGEGSGSRHGLLHETSGGDWDLSRSWQWFWSTRRHLSLQVGVSSRVLNLNSSYGLLNELLTPNIWIVDMKHSSVLHCFISSKSV